jgi:hypothetical protein
LALTPVKLAHEGKRYPTVKFTAVKTAEKTYNPIHIQDTAYCG